MDFTFSPEQQMLADTVRSMCESGCDSETVRQTELNGDPFPSLLWTHLASAGLLGLTLPEEHGGLGAGLIEMSLLAQELGRAAAPITPIISSVLAGGLIARGGSDAQRAEWLPRIADGSALVSIAWLEGAGGYFPDEIRLQATPDGDKVRLQGSKALVPFGDRADAFIVVARSCESEDIDLYLIPAGPGTSTEPHRTMAGEPVHSLALDVTLSSGSRIGEMGEGWSLLREQMLETAVALAAYACGGARQALDMATDYAKHREQFGRPIGANQAIAHPLVDTLVAVEGATSLMYEAAWAIDAQCDARVLAAMTKQRCCQVYRDAAAVAHQVFGGIGFTLDVDVQLYSRRAKQLQLTWWDNCYLTAHLAEELLDAGGPGLLPPVISRTGAGGA
ncbi:acyl-CoA dehydrogenase family protein [Dietzia sp. B32]|uniref:acyl-CoA dehydrogenase family protein n=1 Tax=Dietzia sp. B32 TaxID=2915130 RepID=UPI0021AE227D|nr:acyl-CoA dehydrogenase family protein [Dietzia sp. B32]UVE93813.1 acyl-CoA/acyl-ACP dehydrogenase [Dietzia sp. B32]